MPSSITCSGVRMCGREASAPGIGPRVTPFRPSPAHSAPVATTTRSASAAAHAGRVEAHARLDLDVGELGELAQPPGAQPVPLAEARQARDPAGDAARLVAGIDQAHAPHASLAEHDRALHPGRPGAHHQHLAVGVLRRGSNRSGCQPRRCSSPAVAFWVQPMWRRTSPFEMHMLQPMQSRMSSMRPVRIFSGRNGSAMFGRAAPIRSQTPDSMISAIRSGSVSRPTPTIGLPVASRTCPVHSSCQPSVKKRDAPESFDHSRIEPMWTSHRSTRWSAMRTNSSPSSSSTPGPPAARHGDPAGDRAVVADGVADGLAASRSRSGRGSRASRRSRRCAGCRRARASARAGRSGRRRRRRCRTRRRASGRRPHPVADDAVDVELLHRLGGDVRVVARDLRRGRRRQPRLAVLAVGAGVRELDARERAVGVGGVAHHREVAQVVVVPHPGRDEGRLVGVGR